MKKINQTLLLLASVLILSIQETQASKYSLLLQSGSFTPKANFEDWSKHPEILPEESIHGYYYRYVQFSRIPSLGEQAMLAQQGILLQSYLPHFTYVAAIPVSFDRTAIQDLPVRSVIPITPVYKINPSIAGNTYPDHAIKVAGKIDIHVQYYGNLPHSLIRHQLSAANHRIIHEYRRAHRFTLRIPLEDIEKVASLPWVRYIEAIPPPAEPEDTRGRTLHRSNAIFTDYGAGRQYDGEGVNISINDDGIVGPHIDFTGRIEQSEVIGVMLGDHGDMTSGIAGGAGNLDPTMRGMASGAYLKIRQYNADMTGSDSLHNTEDIMIFSTSYSDGCNAGYTTVTELMDKEIFDNPSLLQVFSAGNSGTFDCGYGAGTGWGNVTGGHKIAKNVIATANVNATDELDNFSSIGPAADGRLKPDIAANGLGQWSTDPNNTYAEGGGTSAAAPGIAGVCAQLYQAYRALNGGANPESALIKACLLNTAEDLGNPGPDFTFGWGRVNALRAINLIEQNQYLQDSVEQGQLDKQIISVPAGLSQLKVMIYWRDPEANPAAAIDLVNNLDFLMKAPDSTSFQPLVLDPTPNATNLGADAAPGTDTLNNMEQVTINDPLGGNYLLTIEGTAIPFGKAAYYVVYEFVENEIVVTYPAGGEGFVPNESERLRWDAIGDTGNFHLEYSTDNGNIWNTISNNVNGDRRYYDWVVPIAATVTGEAFIRISRGATTGMNAQPLSIIGLPANLSIGFACPDSFSLTWNAVGSASAYEVSMLGTKYMDSVGTTTATSYTFTNVNPINEYWVSVKALGPDNARGRRANAIFKAPGLVNCPLQEDVQVLEVVKPLQGSFHECSFQGAQPVEVILTNKGSMDISNFGINFQWNADPPENETFTPTLAAGDTATFTFQGTFSQPSAGDNELVVWTSLPNDENLYNDSLTQKLDVQNGSALALLVVNDFETDDNCSVNLDCGFTVCPLKNDWLNEANGLHDDIDWRVNNGTTASTQTGPTSDHTTGNNSGKYIYLEASSCDNSTAHLISPCIDLTGETNARLSYWYHMRGSEQGSLHVDILHNEEWINDYISVVSGEQGNAWINNIADLSTFSGGIINIRFRGTTGPGRRSDMALDDIMIGSPPASAFSYTGTLCYNDTITFTDQSTGSADTYEWLFGSGASMSSANTAGPHKVVYATGGPKEIKLITTNSFGPDTLTEIIEIHGPGKLASYFYSDNGDGVTFNFVNNNTEATTYFWDFGDGNTSNEISPTHTYDQDGTYEVMAIVSNDCLTDTVIRTVTALANGIGPISTSSVFRIYPNPVKGNLNVRVSGIRGQGVARIFDVHGKLVLSRSINLSPDQENYTIPATTLTAGIYLLTLETNGQKFSGRFGVL